VTKIEHDQVLFGADPSEGIVAVDSIQATAPAMEDRGLSAGSFPAL